MKTLRVTVQFCLLLCLLSAVASVASASTLTLSGDLHFPSLDGSAQDSDGLANGTFTVDGDLVLEGTINCNDSQPLPQGASACPIRISVTGDLTLEPGSGIFAENRRGSGGGGSIQLDVGGDLTLHGSTESVSGAVVSTSQVLGTGGPAGALTAVVAGAVDLQEGSVLAANSKGASAGAISVTGDTVLVAGLVAAGPSQNLLPTPLSGEVLDEGSVSQAGGTIHLRALGSSEPGLRIESAGIVVSQGEGNGGRLILLEACGIEVRGLVASLSRNKGPSQVVLRSGKGIVVDGRDLGSPAPTESRFGRIRADGTQQGAAGYLVDLFAQSDIQVLGPAPSSAQGLFAVTSRPGDQPLRNAGGTITAISLAGSLTATGNAFETGRDVQGDKGGAVDLQARGDVALDDATIWAVGGFTSNLSLNARAGGHIDIRSFQGAVSWTFGVGDVRPTGTGVPLARRGTIEITACTTVDITGTQFPVTGSAVAPFPVETEGVCSPAAPSLPAGEPPLPACAPANQPPAPSGGPFSLEENSANGMPVGTVSANDPDPGQTHTFSIFSGNTGDAFAINPSTGEITVNDSTALDFETTPSFSLVIRATDDGVPAQFGDGTVIVTLTNRNEAPTDLALDGPLTVNENAPAGTLIGNLSTVDPDASDSHTYTLVPGDGSTHNGSFQISGNQLQVLLPPSYEANQTLSVRVRTTDVGGLFHEESFTITVIDLNEPPTPVLDTYTAFGNTQLVAGGLAGTHRAFSTDPDQVDSNDTDPDSNPAFRNLSVIAGSGTTSKGGSYSIDTDGRFTYQPPVGFVTTTANPADPTGPDTFSYSLTDGTNVVPGGEVRITVNHRIWYVHNTPGTAGNAGDSADPVDTLAEAETKSSAGDHIYVFEGDGSDTGMDTGITLKDGQKLIGERFDLVVAGTTLVDADGTRRPEISDSNDTVSALANTANGHRTGIEIRGLQLSSTGGNAIDLTSADAANLEATIHDVIVTGTGAGQEGIDVNAGSTGTATLAIHGNAFETLGTAIDVQRTAGTAYIKTFDANAVSGNNAGMGINVAGAIFDAVPGGAIDTVSGGVTVIGAPGNGVGQSGMVLVNVQGSLSFLDLDIFADGGAGLRVSGTGSGMTFGVLPGAGIIEATGGPAVDIAQTAITLPLSSIKSTNSPSTGLALNSVTGTFSAGSSSSISNVASAAGTAFQVGSSNAIISYAGTISTTQGKGVDLTSNAGSTITLTGTLTLNTGANTAFNATGGGTVTATDTANSLTTTTATALNVASTTIGAGGLKFRSVSVNGAPNGIVLSGTGTSGGLAISGTGSAGSGGTIQNTTNRGASFTDAAGIELNWMTFTNAATTNGADPTSASSTCGDLNVGGNLGCNASIHLANVSGIGGNPAAKLNRLTINGSAQVGININNVNGLELTNATLTGIGNQVREFGLKGRNLLGSVTISGLSISGSFGENFRVENSTGTTTTTVTGSTFASSSQGGGFFHIAQGSAQTDVDVSTSSFTGNFTTGLLVGVSDPAATGSANLDVTGGPFTTNNAGIQVIGAGGADVTFNIHDIGNISGNPAGGIALDLSDTSTAAGSLIGQIANNVVTMPTTGSGNGIGVTARGAGTSTVQVTGNIVTNRSQYGIHLHRKEGVGGTLNATVTGNAVTTVDVAADTQFPIDGIRVEAGAASGDTGTLCAHIASNTATGANSVPAESPGDDIRLRHRFGITFRLPGLSGSTSTDADNHVTGLNPGATLVGATTTTSFTGGAACPLP